MIPNSRPDQRTPMFVEMLRAAAIDAPPTRYTQNMRQGTNAGTMGRTKPGLERWSAGRHYDVRREPSA